MGHRIVTSQRVSDLINRLKKRGRSEFGWLFFYVSI